MTAEDFMDEEDLADLAESQQVSTKAQFEGIGEGAQSRKPVDLFEDMLRPKEDTMGIKLLRKMGWRQGQGIGPRVKRTMMDDSDDEANESGKTYSLAPINTAVIDLQRKTNTQGLGYTTLPGLERKTEKPVKKQVTSNSKFGMRGSMGIGVLNEDDDEDPYDVGFTKDQYSRTVVPKREKPEGSITFKPSAKHVFTSKTKSTSTVSTSSNRRGHDGRLPLPGFILSETQATLTIQWYQL